MVFGICEARLGVRQLQWARIDQGIWYFLNLSELLIKRRYSDEADVSHEIRRIRIEHLSATS